MSFLSYKESGFTEAFIANELKLALESKNNYQMYYCGGSLCVDINEDVLAMSIKEDTTDKIKFLLSILYTKYKTKNHCYYNDCLKIIGDNLSYMFKLNELCEC